MWPRTKNAMTRKGPAGPWSSPRDVIITYDRSLTETPMIPRADSVGASPECHVRDHSPSSSAAQRFIPGRLLVSRLRCQDTTTVVAMSRFLELSFQQLAGCEELTSGLIAEGVTGRPLQTGNSRACAFVRSLSVVVSGASPCGCRRIANVGQPAAIGEVSHDLQSLVFRQTLFAGPLNEITTVVG